ncbi:MAG: hypothetical protein PWQ28_209 [Candidatus Woesearchaeota archaeon]|nr:hypothetical protein [Candidatus Woesearchaeota archaeon]
MEAKAVARKKNINVQIAKKFLMQYLFDFVIVSIPFIAVISMLNLSYSAVNDVLALTNRTISYEEIDEANSMLSNAELRLNLSIFVGISLIIYLFLIPIIRRFQYKKIVKKPMNLGFFYLISLGMAGIIIGILYLSSLFESSLFVSILSIYITLFIFNLLNEKRIGYKKDTLEFKNIGKIAIFSLIHFGFVYLILLLASIPYVFVFVAPLLIVFNRIIFLKKFLNQKFLSIHQHNGS